MKSLRIAAFGFRFIPPQDGSAGADKFAVELYSRLVKKGIEVIAYNRIYDEIQLRERFVNGTPVIASDLGSLKELVIENETGYLFEPGNSFDLAQKIIKLFDNFNRINFIQNSIEFVKKYHSEKEHYNKLMLVFNHIRKA
jgi:glycosyltransferase involved in cell wall biosynthesis